MSRHPLRIDPQAEGSVRRDRSVNFFSSESVANRIVVVTVIWARYLCPTSMVPTVGNSGPDAHGNFRRLAQRNETNESLYRFRRVYRAPLLLKYLLQRLGQSNQRSGQFE